MRCDECDWDYPESLLSSMTIGNLGVTQPICGPCALELANTIMGFERTSFSGEIAEKMRLDALEWRKSYPQNKPKVIFR